jgi:RecA-family ATPase
MADNSGTLPSLQTVAHALGGEVNGGQVLAPGPGHSPQDRSMSIKVDAGAPDGFLTHSFSGDDVNTCRDYVRAKLALPAFKPNSGRRRASTETIERMLMAVVGAQSQKPRAQIVAAYNYTGANGELIYQVLRLEPKSFRQRRPDPDNNGKWIWKLDDQRVVYRWPDLLKYPDATVFVCEGEKDADRVAELNLCSTTVAAGKWTDDCIKALAGRDVIIFEDNDDAGRKKAREAATVLLGTANSIRIVSLPGLPDKGDVSDWLDADPNRAKKFVDVCFDVPLWEPDKGVNHTLNQGDNITLENAKAETAPTESKPASEKKLPLTPFINIATWEDHAVPRRQWIVRDRIPASSVTLLSGEGSVGKSILSLQLATATMLGRDWINTMPEQGPVIVVCCEDDEHELHRRLDLIRQHYGVAFTDFKDMHLLSLAGQETLMAVPDRNGLIQPTKLFASIHEAACDIKPQLIVLDNAADIYGGSENDRAEVRQFIGILRHMAIASGAGVLLTSHPSLTGISSGTGLSGSTAWNASVRSRLYFKRATTEKDEEPDPDLRVLVVMKANYGPIGETVNLRWKNGLFVPVGGVTNLEKLAAEQATEHLFLSLLNRFNTQNRNLSDKSSANNYAPAMFAKEKEAREAGVKKAAIETAMRNLFAADKIRLELYGPRSKTASRLVSK